MFHFSYDPNKVLVKLTQQGYWTLAEFKAFEAEFLTLHATIRETSRNYRVLADCRDFPVQSAEIGEAFRVLFDRLMNENKGYYAIVVGSMLNKLQAKRAIPHAHVQVFVDVDEAMTWLMEDGSLPD